MSFKASYPGECGGCGASFDTGDEIEYDSYDTIIISECCGELDFDPEEYDEPGHGYWGAGDY